MSEPRRTRSRRTRRSAPAVRRASVRRGVGAALAVFAVSAIVVAVTFVSPSAPNAPGPTGRSGAAVAAEARLTAATGPRKRTQPSNPYAKLITRIPGDPLALGKLHAPVVIVEWADYQCPYCGRFARDTEPVLIRKYVDTGEVRLEWRDFPYLGPQSTTAAIAARAAGMQGKFWLYHNALYADQQSVNSGYLTKAFLVGLARKLGLNIERFKVDLANPILAEEVKADYDQGLDVGIMATPAFLVGSTPVMGAQPLSVFEKLIDKSLAQTRK